MKFFGSLVVFFLVAVPAMAQHDSERSPQGVCRIAMEAELWAGSFNVEKADTVDRKFYRFRLDVSELCKIQPDSSQLRDGQAITWLESADAAVERLLDGVYSQMFQPENTGRLQIVMGLAYQMEHALGPMRTQAYQAFRRRQP